MKSLYLYIGNVCFINGIIFYIWNCVLLCKSYLIYIWKSCFCVAQLCPPTYKNQVLYIWNIYRTMTDPNRTTGHEADIDSGSGPSASKSMQSGFVGKFKCCTSKLVWNSIETSCNCIEKINRYVDSYIYFPVPPATPAIDIPTTSNRPISPAAGPLPHWIAGMDMIFIQG